MEHELQGNQDDLTGDVDAARGQAVPAPREEATLSKKADSDLLLSVREAASLMGLHSDTLREYGKRASESGAEWPQRRPKGWLAPAEEWSRLMTLTELLAHQKSYARQYSRRTVSPQVPGENRVAAPVSGRCPRCGATLRRSRWASGEMQGTELTCVCGYNWS